MSEGETTRDEPACEPAGEGDASGAMVEPATTDRVAQTRLLDSVAAFTHHRDMGALDHSLVLTLAELTAAQGVTLVTRAADTSAVNDMVHCEPDAQGKYRLGVGEPDGNDPALAALFRCMDDGKVQAEQAGETHRLVVPIQRDGRVIGALQMDSGAPSATNQPLAEGFARIYANYTALLYESERDKLTGLYNRRTLERQFQRLLLQHEQALERGSESSLPPGEQPRVWLAILDIDHFKQVNDTYGHVLGDEVILLLAQRMRHCFRRGDVLFRFGGEEFVVLFGSISETEVRAVLERFRQLVADSAFPQVGRVTISAGYAGVGRHDYPESVLGRADKALYFVKNHGRNGVRGYEDLRERGELEDDIAAGSIDLF